MAALTIAGGGPAGLACGIRLRELGLEAEVFERQRYPLRKLCGEFLSDAGWSRLEKLGAAALLPEAPPLLNHARFYYGGDKYFSFELDPPARGLTRANMDSALKDRFLALGGRLHEGQSAPEGAQVLATGRQLSKDGPWNAWKAYAPYDDLPAPLLMLGMEGAYAGIAQVEGKRLSVCMLWKGPRRAEEVLSLHPLLASLAPKLIFHASAAGFDFHRRFAPGKVGDAGAAWPPVAGDGMSRALKDGMELAEALAGRGKSGVSRNHFEFFLSKTLHSLMLSNVARRVLGPLIRPVPTLPAWLYRLSRVH